MCLTARLVSTAIDYQTYKASVEPIILTKRGTHTRCVVCHASANHPFRLEPLNNGATTWTEAQSRKNFETVSERRDTLCAVSYGSRTSTRDSAPGCFPIS